MMSNLVAQQNINPEQIKIMLERAKEIRTSNPDSCLLLADLVFANTRDKHEKIYAEYLAGHSFFRQRKYDTAYYLLDKSLDYFDNVFEQGIVLTTIGKIFLRQENFSYAEDYFLRALGVYEALDEQANQFYALNDLGTVQYNKGDYNKALALYLQAKDRAIDFGMEDRLVRLLNNIIGVYTMLNQNDKALEMAREAIAISQKTNDPIDQKTAMTAMGYVQKKLGNLDSAIYYNEKAMEFAQKANDFFSISWQYADQGDIMLLKKEYKRAIRAYQNALGRLVADGAMEDTDVLRMKIAEVFITLQNYDSAATYAIEAHQSATKSNSKWPIYKSSELLGDIYMNMNDLKQASTFYQKALGYKDSIYNDRNQQQFADQRVKLETLEKVKTIDSLKKQAKIDALVRDRLVILLVAIAVIAILLITIAIIWYRNKQRLQHHATLILEREIRQARDDLNQQTLHMIHINNSLTVVEEELKKIPREQKPIEVQQVLKKIHLGKAQEKDWENFNKYFGNVHTHFYGQLQALSDKLTLHEQRICALLKMNLTNREIATLLNIESKSVKMIKYRIKKKLTLDETTDLYKFLQDLGTVELHLN